MTAASVSEQRPLRAEYINPFLSSTASVFSQMLGVDIRRLPPYLRDGHWPMYGVTGVIGLTGKTTGTVAISVTKEMALAVTGKLVGEEPTELNASVVDAIGELTNMIAGAAKAQLEQMELSLGLPTVITGKSTCIAFPSNATPISIPFDSELGEFVVEVGFRA
jgi:chemotaxis protein CheX